MKKTWKKLLSTVVAALLVASMIVMSASAFETPGGDKGSNIIEYLGSTADGVVKSGSDATTYNKAKYPPKQGNTVFTAATIAVDGELDDAYQAANKLNIGTYFASKGTNETPATGELYTLWNGPTLYVAVKVTDDDVQNNGGGVDVATSNPSGAGTVTQSMWGATLTENTDSVSIGIDLYDDKFYFEHDAAGVVTFGVDGGVYYFRNANIPSLSSVFDPESSEFINILQEHAVKPCDGGYIVEAAFYIGETDPKNGNKIGLEVAIADINNTGSKVEKQGYTFWSHEQETLYKQFDCERPNSVDWGDLTLTGFDAGSQTYATSTWGIKKILDFMKSPAFPTGVYTVETTGKLANATADAENVMKKANPTAAEVKEAFDALKAAFDGLRWGNTKYPDPADLPKLNTLPNPFKFFNSDRVVKSLEDWTERKNEILDLAQFYEYGYKPEYDKLTVTGAGTTQVPHMTYDYSNPYWYFGPPTLWDGETYDEICHIAFDIEVGAKKESFDITITKPSQEIIDQAKLDGRELPIIFGEAGAPSGTYNQNGFYSISVPAVVSDTRTNAYAWGTRTGQFYNLYPYSRNGKAALNEVSNEMAMAWMTSAIIDALEDAKFGDNADFKAGLEGIDVTKLAVTGFSINGKYAFVAGVFDERIDVTIPGASGASGASPWRYVYRGQEYDFTGTPFVGAGGGAKIIAFGTEVLQNSVRHNRVRETELFRHFLTIGHMCEYEEGAYGYGTRLPFDQNDLIAAMAPRVMIINNTPNDFNDGSVADALSAEVAKSVYNTLGYDGDNLVLFNYREIVESGDPHGSSGSQTLRECEFMNNYFFGDELSTETETRLKTDPFNLKVANKRTQTPYDYYWGGFNTITGGSSVEGKDGWYYYSFDNDDEVVRDGQEGTHTVGATNRLIYHFEEELADLVKVQIDGVDVTPVKTWEGSTYVELNNADLDKLTTGDHVVTAIFKNREISSDLKVLSAPPTGDSTMIFVLLGILAMAAAAAVLFMTKKRA